ncbi:MAG: heme-dependent oxidative N-demethylase subunit alpha family protein [Pseudomonadota bacterium]|nr:heme-dependent oxidative N-demethylase subunit alpha family protein [Pseudomonadota bacterium]
MTLGFSVEALLPQARVEGPLRMGLVRLPEAEWLDPAPDLAARAAAFDAHPHSVIAGPEAAEAIAELGGLLGVEGDLEACARACWEDLCIMVQDAPGAPFRLTAAAVAFPTDWRLEEKMGLSTAAIHAPIDGYEEALASGVDTFMEGLQSFNIFGRTNAFVVASDALRYLPDTAPEARFAHVTPENAGSTLFVRCEREALRRLKRSRAIVFTIGIYRARLDSLSDAALARIARSVEGFGADEAARRAAPHYADALRGYAQRRLGETVQ